MARAAKVPKNRKLTQGINARGRAATQYKRFKFSKVGSKSKKIASVVAKAKADEQKEDVPSSVKSRFYSAEDIRRPLKTRKHKVKPQALRSTIRPGQVLILLGGQFRGRRVVFLKQLPSGLLLVTGPYKINGVPLRRVNQVFVISTSTSVDISGVDVSKVDDSFFARQDSDDEKQQGKDEFFAKAEKKKVVDPKKKETQVAVDAKLLAAINKVPLLKLYLKDKFTLRNGQYPHILKF